MSRIVNDPIDRLAEAKAPGAELIRIGGNLAFCQQRCTHWDQACCRMDPEEWFTLMLDPARRCRCWPTSAVVPPGLD